MKKALIAQLLLILLLPMGTFCQLNKGSWLGSYSAGLTYNHNIYDLGGDYNYKNDIINFSISSKMGLFVADRLAIGPGISFDLNYIQYTDENIYGTTKSHSTIYTAALNPFIRYYFASQGKFAFFVEGDGTIGYGQGFYKDISQKGTTNTLTYGGGAGIGLVYFIMNNIGMETQFSYNYTGNKITQKEVDTGKENSSNSAIGIRVGLSFYFGKCKKQEKEENQKK